MSTITVTAHWGHSDPGAWLSPLALTGTERMERAVLTTDHPASSHGMPVLVIDGVAYGPRDLDNLRISLDDIADREWDEQDGPEVRHGKVAVDLARRAIIAGFAVTGGITPSDAWQAEADGRTHWDGCRGKVDRISGFCLLCDADVLS